MKKFTLVIIALSLVITGFSQSYKNNIPKSLQNIKVERPVPVKDMGMGLKQENFLTTPKSTLEPALGTTVYDLQTNSSVANRLYRDTDGKLYGIWTMGQTQTAFADRGTGYNKSDGTTWGPAPTARIENARVGWPSYAPWGPTGEIVVSHTDVSGLKVCTRPVKGTGTWTQSILAGPAGAVDISWPRVITNGPNNNYIHIICMTYVAYQGLDLALIYYRSLDGGATWDIVNEVLPGMSSSDGLGYSGDAYAWGTPKGDTIYFAVGDQWSDAFIMKSFDNGLSWSKTMIFNNGYKMIPTTGSSDGIFACPDGSVCVEMDSQGTFHFVMGRQRASNDGSGRVYYPFTDGLIYWNSTMPLLNDSLDLDTLDAHGQLLGYVVTTATDSVIDIPYYGVSLSSFPQITIDENDNIFVIWSPVTVGNPYNGMNYRHIWWRKSLDRGVNWTDMVDLNTGLAYIYKEFVFPSMAKSTDSRFHFIYQTADVPGSAVKDANVAYHTNITEYRAIDKGTIGVNENTGVSANTISAVYPNPASGKVFATVELARTANVSVEISNLLGQKVISLNQGIMTSGKYDIPVELKGINAGVYFLTVKMDKESVTRKMIVE